MTELLPLVRRLQLEAADSSKSVSDLLRLAKMAATKLDAKDALTWIDRELEGYSSIPAKDLPEYRKIYGKPEAQNPYHGWQPIMFKDAASAEACSYCPVGQSLGSLEAILKRADKDGAFTFDYPAELAANVQKAIGFDLPVHISIGYGSIWNIVDQVRNLILNWSLALEQAGVLGEAMTFTPKEKIEAGPINNQYFIQNVGVIGNLTENASVQQTTSISLNLKSVADFLNALKDSAPGLPPKVRDEVMSQATKAEAALAAEKPEQGIIRSALTAIGNVCEGAAGNLTAIGIAEAIRTLMSS
jgi:AbiTii